MRKKTIIILMILSVVLTLIGSLEPVIEFIVTISSASACLNADVSCYINYFFFGDSNSELLFLVLSTLSFLLISIASLLGLIAWIGALVKQSRAQQWIWFICTLLFGLMFSSNIVVLIYLIAVPEKQTSPLQPGSYRPVQQPIVYPPGRQPAAYFPGHQPPYFQPANPSISFSVSSSIQPLYPSLQPTITFLTGPYAGSTWTITQPNFTLGRDKRGNDLVLTDELHISRYHARIVQNGTQWYIEKIASANIVTVNSQQVVRSPLSNGDTIGMGQAATTTFVFRVSQ